MNNRRGNGLGWLFGRKLRKFFRSILMMALCQLMFQAESLALHLQKLLIICTDFQLVTDQ